MANTPQSSSRKPNCTTVADRFHADAFEVCRAGSMVALHCYTRRGEIVLTVSEAEFLKTARGAKDSNGLPWRELQDPKQREQIILADVAAIEAKKRVRAPRVCHVPQFELVEKQKQAGSPLSYRILCDQAGVPEASFYSWRSRMGLAGTSKRNMEAVA